MSFSTGTAVRVVDFKSQYWMDSEFDDRRAEQALMTWYLGKVGTVTHVDGWRMPIRVEFGVDVRVPIREMRFHAEEVEAVG